MEQSDGKGFGYVNSNSSICDDLNLTDDSRLSSTSLLKSLIEPSSSHVSSGYDHWKEEPDADDPRYSKARESARMSLGYLRQSERVVKTGMNLDYEALRKKDTERAYEKQAIPVLSDKSRKTFSRKNPGFPASDSVFMPLMSYLGLKESHYYHSFSVRPRGKVYSLLEYIDDDLKAVNRRRSELLLMYKEHLDLEKEEELENRANETVYEKKLREEREEEEKRRESEVYKDYTEKEITVIKENLGTLPIRKESVFLPLGKAKIIGSQEETAEEFFTHLPERNLSYDEYYKKKDDKEFGRLTVTHGKKKVRLNVESQEKSEAETENRQGSE